MQNQKQYSRRKFLNKAVAGSAVTMMAPMVVTAKKTDGPMIVGVEGHRYEVQHLWPQLPEKFRWHRTHSVAVDSEGLLYVCHEGYTDQPDHPTIFVFDREGQYVRSFGSQFLGGGHGVEVRNEGGQDFLYVTAYKGQHSVAKLDTKGEQLWRKGAPMESGFYREEEDKFPDKFKPFTRKSFLPTNVAFHPEGDFYLIDGYGAYRVHRYDKDGNWLSSFGKPAGKKQADGTFNLPHGIWVDDRGDESRVVVADRMAGRLQWFTLEGEHVQTVKGLIQPANVDVLGDVMLVPDIMGRVTLFDKQNQVIAHLGDDSLRVAADQKDNGKLDIREDESKWLPGKFIHPHDACFDREGNIFVGEFVKSGRVTRLRKLS